MPALGLMCVSGMIPVRNAMPTFSMMLELAMLRANGEDEIRDA